MRSCSPPPRNRDRECGRAVRGKLDARETGSDHGDGRMLGRMSDLGQSPVEAMASACVSIEKACSAPEPVPSLALRRRPPTVVSERVSDARLSTRPAA